MGYATKNDIEDIFGVANVAAWSNLDGDTDTADDSRINRAIVWATVHVNSRFRGHMWAVPLVGQDTSTIVKGWVATLAGYWLQRPRGTTEDMQVLREHVSESINAYITGAQEWDAALQGTHATSPHVVKDRSSR